MGEGLGRGWGFIKRGERLRELCDWLSGAAVLFGCVCERRRGGETEIWTGSCFVVKKVWATRLGR